MTPPKAGANMFDNKDWNILNLNDAGKRYLTLALNEDGLIVVDQTSGMIVANQCFVINLRGGGNEGGGKASFGEGDRQEGTSVMRDQG
mmetsp:Transcript_82258/g.232894  ORF Transcript_82258/g.232894 Transcript_82258/m.232894 type:complete len:88 (+) Transcript_82258:239-502(+)